MIIELPTEEDYLNRILSQHLDLGTKKHLKGDSNMKINKLLRYVNL